MEVTDNLVKSCGILPLGWRCSSAVERRSLTDELSLACTEPAADG